jgi:hypothetical protein
MTEPVGSDQIVASLQSVATPGSADAIRQRVDPDEEVFGLRMRDVFAIARSHQDVPLTVVGQLLDHAAYEPRLTAFCILDFQARRRLDDTGRRDRYALYLRRHDSITAWDMVDRAAPRVVGGYLAGRDLAPLRELAVSPDPLRRRTAITAPLFFTRSGSATDLAGGFGLAAVLADDAQPVVHNAVGIFLKHAGTRDPAALTTFLQDNATRMPRPALRLAIEKLPAAERTAILRA